MGHVVNPGQIRIVTREGEITIHLTLDLNVNLNTDTIKVNVAAEEKPKLPDLVEEDKEKTAWEIPDFESHTGMNFGKTIE